MDKFRKIWPTMAALARDLGVPYPTVGAWPRRGIPARRLPDIARAARAAGVELTFEELTALTVPFADPASAPAPSGEAA